jgi:serine/threonine-protein kinase
MVMEYLQGESLRALLNRNGPLPLPFAIDIARQALEGLAATHEAGIVHRDLKPDNLILVYEGGEEPTVKIIDFGISKYTPDRTADLTTSGIVLGTARYMSPEQAEGRDDLDQRTDIYSLGVVLYHMLTGAFPHEGASHKETLAHVLHQPPVPPAERCAGFPDGASRVILKALARDPADRYPGALEMADALAGLDLAGACMERAVAAPGEDDVSVVSGDLGEPTAPGAPDDTQPARPGGRKATIREMPPARARPAVREWVSANASPRSRLRKAVVAALVLAVLGLGAWAFWRSGALAGLAAKKPAVSAPAKAAAAVPPAPRAADPGSAVSPAAAPQGVLVTVEGTPAGSRVFWDGALVPMNPFRVERRETIVPLRVEADGYESFSIAVLPAEDQIVRVEMAPMKLVAPRRAGSGHGALLDRGSASTGGVRAMAEQKSVIGRNKHALKRCYDQALQRGDAQRDADLVVHFRLDVGPNGQVRGADLAGTGAAVAPFAQCLDKEVRSWFFLPSNGAAVVSFSFAFTTRGG